MVRINIRSYGIKLIVLNLKGNKLHYPYSTWVSLQLTLTKNIENDSFDDFEPP